jgi:hypothetical protein
MPGEKKMRMSRMILVCICLVGFSSVLWAQQKKQDASEKGVLGYFNPKTGQFTVLAKRPVQNIDAVVPGAVTPTTGLFQITFVITIVTKLPPNTVIGCEMDVNEFPDAEPFTDPSYFETAKATASVSGSTATCTATMNYSWTLADPGSDDVTLTWSIAAFDAATVGSGTEDYDSRSTSSTYGTFAVPKSGSKNIVGSYAVTI